MFQRWVPVLVRDSKQFYFLKKEKGKVKYVWKVGWGFPLLDSEQFFKTKQIINFQDHSFLLDPSRKWKFLRKVAWGLISQNVALGTYCEEEDKR